MKTKFLVFIFVLINSYLAHAQYTLEECYEKAHKNYPLIRQVDLIDKTEAFTISNATKVYLPQVSASGKASYQSDVTELPVKIPFSQIDPMSKDQYTISVDVNQLLWDGGVSKANKKIAKETSQVDKSQIEVDLYKIKERINQIYFGILLIKEQIDQNDLFQKELQRNYKLVESYKKNGIANQSDLDVIKVEQIKAKQNKAQLENNEKYYLKALSLFIGENVSSYDQITKPEASYDFVDFSNKRPELDFFTAQASKLEAQKDMIKSSYMPKVGLFATGGYGRPGLNMLDRDFSAFFVGGVRFSWNFGSLYTKKNDLSKIDVAKDIVSVQRDTFLFNLDLELENLNNQIKNNEELLNYDKEIITLKSNIKKASEVKLANGVISVSDLIKDINSEDLAKQEKILHEIQLLMSIYKLKNTLNNY